MRIAFHLRRLAIISMRSNPGSMRPFPVQGGRFSGAGMCMADVVPYLLIEIFIAPLFHMFKDRDETFSQSGKVILHMGRDFFVIMAGNEPVRFQFPKLLCQA